MILLGGEVAITSPGRITASLPASIFCELPLNGNNYYRDSLSTIEKHTFLSLYLTLILTSALGELLLQTSPCQLSMLQSLCIPNQNPSLPCRSNLSPSRIYYTVRMTTGMQSTHQSIHRKGFMLTSF